MRTTKWWSWVLTESAAVLCTSVDVTNCLPLVWIILLSARWPRHRVVRYLSFRLVSSKCIEFMSGRIRMRFKVGILKLTPLWMVQDACFHTWYILNGGNENHVHFCVPSSPVFSYASDRRYFLWKNENLLDMVGVNSVYIMTVVEIVG